MMKRAIIERHQEGKYPLCAAVLLHSFQNEVLMKKQSSLCRTKTAEPKVTERENKTLQVQAGRGDDNNSCGGGEGGAFLGLFL